MGLVKVVDHPIVRCKLTRLRDKATDHKEFGELIRELTIFLGVEATADLELDEVPVQTPDASARGWVPKEKIGLVPIIRAGISMAEGLRMLMPNVPVWHIISRRNEETLEPTCHHHYLPERTECSEVNTCLVLDPELATGGSAVSAIHLLKEWGGAGLKIRFIGIVAAPEGVENLRRAHPDVRIHLAALDERLDERGSILPGIGNPGKRENG